MRKLMCARHPQTVRVPARCGAAERVNGWRRMEAALSVTRKLIITAVLQFFRCFTARIS